MSKERKKHTIKDRIKYIKLLEEGYVYTFSLKKGWKSQEPAPRIMRVSVLCQIVVQRNVGTTQPQASPYLQWRHKTATFGHLTRYFVGLVRPQMVYFRLGQQSHKPRRTFLAG